MAKQLAPVSAHLEEAGNAAANDNSGLSQGSHTSTSHALSQESPSSKFTSHIDAAKVCSTHYREFSRSSESRSLGTVAIRQSMEDSVAQDQPALAPAPQPSTFRRRVGAWAAKRSDLIPGRSLLLKWGSPPPVKDGTLTILHESSIPDLLAPSWSSAYKWMVLTALSFVQISMNLNASIYGNSRRKMVPALGGTESQAAQGMWLFLIAYAFGCELWAPWSEDLGRKGVLQTSLWLVNTFAGMGGGAQNMATVVAARALGGLSSAGGSVTLGVVADMYGLSDGEQQGPVAYVVHASVQGSVVGPVVGALIEQYVSSWRWIYWAQLYLGIAIALIHLGACPETRSSVLLQREVYRRRALGENVGTEAEVNNTKTTLMDKVRRGAVIMLRPYKMLVTEPIVLFLSLLSGFSDMLIFLFLEAYGEVYSQWNFGVVAGGLAFLPLAIGYTIAWAVNAWDIRRQHRKAAAHNGTSPRGPEEKLRILMFLAPLEVVGLLGFAFCSLGPAAPYHVHWSGPMFFSVLVGIANYAIYFSTVDYMVEAYGPYASSATGGNGFARDFMAGLSALYAKPLYRRITAGPHKPLVAGSLVLAFICCVVVVPVFVFFFKGAAIRARSAFSKKIVKEREAAERELAEREKAEVVERKD